MAFAAAMQILTQGLDEAEPFWVAFLVVYVASWVVLLKNKKARAWMNRQN